MSIESRFRTPAGAQQFLAAYDATLALWPVPHESLQVPTHFGTTHVNTAGAPDSPPLVMIHGGQISSPVWYANVGPLSRHFRVYAPDVVDQMGRSVPTRKLTTPQECAEWLTDLLDGLHLDRATLMGHSHGGWQALNLALQAPQRVDRLVLLSPASAFVSLSKQLFLRMLPVFVMPTRRMFYWSFQWMTILPLDHRQPHPLVEQFMIGAKTFKPQELSLGVVTVFTDDELRQIETPTLLLTGEHEVVYDPRRVVDRARRLMPHLEAELIPHGKHLFPVSQAEATNARILAFLNP